MLSARALSSLHPSQTELVAFVVSRIPPFAQKAQLLLVLSMQTPLPMSLLSGFQKQSPLLHGSRSQVSLLM